MNPFSSLLGAGRGSGRDVLAARQCEADAQARAAYDLSALDGMLGYVQHLGERAAQDLAGAQALRKLPALLGHHAWQRWGAPIDALCAALHTPTLGPKGLDGYVRRVDDRLRPEALPDSVTSIAELDEHIDRCCLRALASELALSAQRSPRATVANVLWELGGVRAATKRMRTPLAGRALRHLSLDAWELIFCEAFGVDDATLRVTPTTIIQSAPAMRRRFLTALLAAVNS